MSGAWTAAGRLCRCPRGLRGLGVVDVAHSRVLCVGGNRGIMRNSNVSSDRGSAPMCNTDDNHAPHRDRSTSGTRSVQVSPANPTSRHARQARGRRPHAAPRSHRRAAGPQQRNRSRGGDVPISTRSTTDLAAEMYRSRRGVRPISARKRTDLGGGRRRRRLPVVDRRAGHGPVGRRQRRSIEHGDLFEAQALVEAP